MSPELRDLVSRHQRRLTLLWVAFLAGTAFYAAIGILVARGIEAAAPAAGLSRLPIIVGVATCGLAVAGAGAAAGRRLLTQALQGKPLGGRPLPPKPSSGKLSDAERYLANRLPAYLTVMIITWASYEAAAVVGLVLSLVLRDPVPAVLGSAVALLLLAANRPQVEPFLAECDRWRRLHRRPGDDQ